MTNQLDDLEQLKLNLKKMRQKADLFARDLNAAINLKNKAVRSTVTACGEDGSGRGGDTATKPASVKQEDLSTSC